MGELLAQNLIRTVPSLGVYRRAHVTESGLGEVKEPNDIRCIFCNESVALLASAKRGVDALAFRNIAYDREVMWSAVELDSPRTHLDRKLGPILSSVLGFIGEIH